MQGRERGQGGKLRWAARAWVNGRLSVRHEAARQDELPEAARDLVHYGAPAETVAALTLHVQGAEDDEGIWPDNLPVVAAFLAAATQWRTAPAGSHGETRVVCIGLDYTAARVAIDAAGIAVTPELWAGLQTMELEAREALNGGAH